MNRLKPGQSSEVASADLLVAGLASNTLTSLDWAVQAFGTVDATACRGALASLSARAAGGDLSDLEAVLAAQVISLNSIFTNLAHRAAVNAGQYLDAMERYMRMALKAQSQCRATVETLAVIKHGPMVIARQANIAHGPQQVNNTLTTTDAEPQLVSRAGNSQRRPTKLLEANGEGLDCRAEGTAGEGDPPVETLETVDRAENASRQSAGVTERVPRRRAAEDARSR